jgi:hypothetical protein
MQAKTNQNDGKENEKDGKEGNQYILNGIRLPIKHKFVNKIV